LVTVACGPANSTPLVNGEIPTMTPMVSETPVVQGAAIPTLEPTATSPADLQGTITLWHSWSEMDRQALLTVIAAFREKYPAVQFDVLYVPQEDLQARFAAIDQAGDGPGMLLGPSGWGPGLFDAGSIQDLSGLVEKTLTADLNQAALGSVQYHQALIGLPYDLQGVVLYRNKAMIAASPDRFENLVKLAQDATKGNKVGAVLERSFFYTGADLNGLGGQLMHPDGTPAFNDAHGVAWINLLLSFSQAGPTEYATDNDLVLFEEGRAGFIIDGTWNMQAISNTIGMDNLAIDPWPFYQDGQLSGYVLSDNLYLSTHARQQDQLALIAFASFLLSPESQAVLAGAGMIPAMLSIPVGNPLIAQAMFALSGGTTYPVGPGMGIYLPALDKALKSIFFENVPLSDALQRASDSILQALAEPALTPTSTP
jgi:ABC-type glycerol-3-phosphate transport system substrate-binding protein